MFRKSLLLLLALSVVAYAQTDFVEGQVIVCFKSGINDVPTAQKQIDSRTYVVEKMLVADPNIFLVKLKNRLETRQAIKNLSTLKPVLWAQLDQKTQKRATFPNDLDFNKQWGLFNNITRADIRASEAWDLGTRGRDRDGNDIVIAVVDGGADIKHKDLKDNIWVNSGEIPNNGIDDDGNGYIDDVNGWNAYESNGNIPVEEHGTHVSGIAAAKGNNGFGITGVNWMAKVMIVAASSRETSVVVEGYGYILKQKRLWLETQGKKGANVVVTNASWGIDFADCNSGEYPVWNSLYNALGDVGVLNAAATINQHVDIDVKGDVPTGCSSKSLVKVTNTDRRDNKHPYAAFGLRTIDLGAPGTDVYSLLPDDDFGNMSGTSMASPHVAGAIAFLHSVGGPEFTRIRKADPARASQLLKQILLSNVDKIPSLTDKTVSGGRLNLFKAAVAISK